MTSVSELEGMSNVATPHRERDGRVFPLYWYNWDAMAAAGGIISSVADMSQWLQLQLGQGTWNGDTIFSESAQRMMWTPHISRMVTPGSERFFPTTHFRGYGLGWSLIDYQGRKVTEGSSGKTRLRLSVT